MTKLKHSYSVLSEQACFDSIAVKKQEQLSWNCTHYVLAKNAYIPLKYSYFGESGFCTG